jgi:hypothetical protein
LPVVPTRRVLGSNGNLLNTKLVHPTALPVIQALLCLLIPSPVILLYVISRRRLTNPGVTPVGMVGNIIKRNVIGIGNEIIPEDVRDS